MPGEVLKVDYVGSALAGRRQSRDAEGMHRYVRIQSQTQHVPCDQMLYRTPGQSLCPKTVESSTTRSLRRTEDRSIGIIPDSCNLDPSIKALECFGMHGYATFLTAFAANLQDAMPTADFVVHHP